MSSFIKEFLGRAKFDDEREQKELAESMGPGYVFPTDLANPMMDYMLERTYLEDISNREDDGKQERSAFSIVSMPKHESKGSFLPCMLGTRNLFSSCNGIMGKLTFTLAFKDLMLGLVPADASVLWLVPCRALTCIFLREKMI